MHLHPNLFGKLLLLEKPLDLQLRLRAGFTQRLIHTLKQRGYISSRSANGVNARALAKALGCSLTMARRYLAQEALPENKTLEKLSHWLKVDVWWLLYGNKEKAEGSVFDKALLKEIFLQSKDLFIKFPQDWSGVLDEILKIYENTLELPGKTEEKIPSIKLLVAFLMKNFKG